MFRLYSEEYLTPYAILSSVAQALFVSRAVRTLNNSGFALLLEVHLCDPFRCYLIQALLDSCRHVSSCDLLLLISCLFFKRVIFITTVCWTQRDWCQINSVFPFYGESVDTQSSRQEEKPQRESHENIHFKIQIFTFEIDLNLHT